MNHLCNLVVLQSNTHPVKGGIMAKGRRSKRALEVLAERTAPVLIGENKYLCDDCGEARLNTDKGRHWSKKRGNICRGRPAKMGNFNAADRERLARRQRERDDKNRSKEYATESGDSIRPIYIGKHHQ